MSRIDEYLDQMLEATQQACTYIEGMNKDDFLADKKNPAGRDIEHHHHWRNRYPIVK